ncbi:DnaD-like protein [Desulfosporosinus acidiphilus SJ4]|uniref:DnaD-like protein n=1 Tax=Desulfosporosinus acidiphilus (strain DSM 22704 / JCM 16185 / SJ4) TaxID=646529 RepID=I4D3N0_DESAJ|nr:DnaD domain protein [Desulfosporosinus acidiphilus]AFM40404.1 DnaD-like protein [Desulfosporosinus acidiphilus SJ4]
MGTSSSNQMHRTRIFTLNELSLRLSPALADEIGLNESILLLQLEYWIHITDHDIEGKRWTYQSVRDMQDKAFTFWSVSTVARTVKSLLDKKLIIEGNYNKDPYDKTRWFALNHKELSKLRSIMIKEYNGNRSETPLSQNDTPLQLHDKIPLSQNETPLCHDETTLIQNDTTLFQNDTTIPQITPQITPEMTLKNVIDVDDDVDIRTRQNDIRQAEPLERNGKSTSPPLQPGKVTGLKAIEFAEINLKRELSEFEREILRDWCAKFRANPNCHDPEAVVIAGLKRCVIKHDLSSLIAYLNRVLENYEFHNITTVEQVNRLNQNRKNPQNPVKNKSDTVLKKSGSVITGKYEPFYL